jgi:antitoxin (DNA-binding transcriptional repressor) of toxin-antitoxin stability system
MKTIGAKQLRDDLGLVVKQVRQGKRFQVFYRSKPAFVLSPIESKPKGYEPGSKEAMRNFVRAVRTMNATRRQSTLDPNKSIKELYHEFLDTDPKYASYRD